MCYISPQQAEQGGQEPTALPRQSGALVPSTPALLPAVALGGVDRGTREGEGVSAACQKTISWGFRGEMGTREAQNALMEEKIRESASLILSGI